jgi:hypothetical protein
MHDDHLVRSQRDAAKHINIGVCFMHLPPLESLKGSQWIEMS